MANIVRVRLRQFIESVRAEGITPVFGKMFFVGKVILPSVKELDVLPPLKLQVKHERVKFIEITSGSFDSSSYNFPSKSRMLRVSKNFSKGYQGFAIVRENDILGDIWYCPGPSSRPAQKHPDLDWFAWFGVELGDHDVYMFEMYVKPQERGGGIVSYLHWNALNALKGRGFHRVYGYCAADNIPALWVHRTLGYKELGRLRMHRLLTVTFRYTKEKSRGILLRILDLS